MSPRQNDPDVPSHSTAEVNDCILSMKRGGCMYRRIPIEAFQESEAAAEALADLLKAIWNTEKLPTDMATGVMLMMRKKGSKDETGNYRALRLLPHAFKVLSMGLLH